MQLKTEIPIVQVVGVEPTRREQGCNPQSKPPPECKPCKLIGQSEKIQTNSAGAGSPSELF